MHIVKDIPSMTKNPQSNSSYECMYQTVDNILRTVLYINPPQNMNQARDIIYQTLVILIHAMRTTIPITLGSTPGALAFNIDMFFSIPLVVD